MKKRIKKIICSYLTLLMLGSIFVGPDVYATPANPSVGESFHGTIIELGPDPLGIVSGNTVIQGVSGTNIPLYCYDANLTEFIYEWNGSSLTWNDKYIKDG